MKSSPYHPATKEEADRLVGLCERGNAYAIIVKGETMVVSASGVLTKTIRKDDAHKFIAFVRAVK